MTARHWIIIFLSLSGLLCAQTIRPVGVPVSTGFNQSSGNSPQELINGHAPPGAVIGFRTPLNTIDDDDSDERHRSSTGGGNFGHAFYTGGGNGKVLVFDLGENYSLDPTNTIFFWNGNQNGQLDRQIVQMDVQVSGALTLAEALDEFNSAPSVNNLSIPVYSSNGDQPAFPLSLSSLGNALESVRFVRMSDFRQNGDSVGVIAEVRFGGVEANPDPIPPSGLTVDSNFLLSSLPVNGVVAVLSTEDEDQETGHTYALVSGEGDDDNNRFLITGNELRVSTSLSDLTDGDILRARVRTTDDTALSFESVLTFAVTSRPIVLTEFLADNEDSLVDEDEDREDWIEIQNIGSTPVNLSGWALTDDPMLVNKWTFPAIQLAPRSFLIVFASGKDRKPTNGGTLHTNFSLNADGEYLALFPPGTNVPATAFIPEFVKQREDVSYSQLGFHLPSPGSSIIGNFFEGLVQDTKFSMDRGFYQDEIVVEISTSTEEANIIYTTDGTFPSETNGTRIMASTAQLTINETTTLRALAVKENFLPSDVDTQSYLFSVDVLTQSRPPGAPGSVDFEMDPEVVNDPAYQGRILSSIESIPSISVVMDPDDLFGNLGIYTNPTSQGPLWERASSIEWIDASGGEDFQIDSAIELQGAGSRTQSPKRNFRLTFKAPFGPRKLRFQIFEDSVANEFDSLVLRNATHDSWTVSQNSWRNNARYVNDAWARETQHLMGHLSPARRWVQLFLNGHYWGIYTLTERPDADFLAENNGGSDDDYDVVNTGRLRDGTIDSWDEVHDIANGSQGSLAGQAGYQALEENLDIDGFMDYLLYNLYMVNIDWPNRNFWAGRRREDGARWRFLNWDAETGFFESWPHARNRNDLNALDYDFLNDGAFRSDPRGAGFFYQRLKQNPEFLIRFADRIQKHARNGGLLSPENAEARYQEHLNFIETILVPESARWGDSQQGNPFTVDEQWAENVSASHWLFTDFFPERSEDMIADFRADGAFPETEAPTLVPFGGSIPEGGVVTISAPEGTIYYTIDGSDPRLTGGGVSPAAVIASGDLTLSEGGLLQARALHQGEWSAMTVATFTDNIPASVENLVVSEINYHPSDPSAAEIATGFDDADDFEFIEVRNISNQAISLAGVRFTVGVNFEFPAGTVLESGENLLVANNAAALLARNPSVTAEMIAGEFFSSNGVPQDERLSNGGERILLLNAAGEVIVDMTYNDRLPWSPQADGGGYSLVFRGGIPNSPDEWRPSITLGGNPGGSDSVEFDGTSDEELLDYVFQAPLELMRDISGGNQLVYRRFLAADDANLTLETSIDLLNWELAGDTFEIESRQLLGDGSEEIRLEEQDSPATRRFVRIRVNRR